MARFFNIGIGEERSNPGIRIKVREDGEAVWMHGKWLDLGEDHGVIVVEGRAEFFRPDGKALSPGDFPAWVVRGGGKHPVIAMVFNLTQFKGGKIRVIGRNGDVSEYSVAA